MSDGPATRSDCEDIEEERGSEGGAAPTFGMREPETMNAPPPSELLASTPWLGLKGDESTATELTGDKRRGGALGAGLSLSLAGESSGRPVLKEVNRWPMLETIDGLGVATGHFHRTSREVWPFASASGWSESSIFGITTTACLSTADHSV